MRTLLFMGLLALLSSCSFFGGGPAETARRFQEAKIGGDIATMQELSINGKIAKLEPLSVYQKALGIFISRHSIVEVASIDSSLTKARVSLRVSQPDGFSPEVFRLMARETPREKNKDLTARESVDQVEKSGFSSPSLETTAVVLNLKRELTGGWKVIE